MISKSFKQFAVGMALAGFMAGASVFANEGDRKHGDGLGFGWGEKMSKDLGLSAEQETQIKQIKDEMRTEMEAMHKKYHERMAAVFNEQQRAKFNAKREARKANMEKHHKEKMERMEKMDKPSKK